MVRYRYPKAGDRLSGIFYARLVSCGLPMESNAASRYFSSWPQAAYQKSRCGKQKARFDL